MHCHLVEIKRRGGPFSCPFFFHDTYGPYLLWYISSIKKYLPWLLSTITAIYQGHLVDTSFYLCGATLGQTVSFDITFFSCAMTCKSISQSGLSKFCQNIFTSWRSFRPRTTSVDLKKFTQILGNLTLHLSHTKILCQTGKICQVKSWCRFFDAILE